MLLQADSEDSDQTGRITDHFVGFVMPRLNFHIETTSDIGIICHCNEFAYAYLTGCKRCSQTTPR